MEKEQKVVGGTCPHCGGKYVQNPHKGTIFCENKCWLKNQPQQNNEQKFTQGLDKDLEEEKWDKISWGKCKHAYLVEAYKNGITLSDDVEKEIEKWADASMRKLSN